MRNSRAIVIGAGIVGLATARALALKGFTVTVMERSHRAVGASIRNFGMIWPIGQPSGKLYERAIRTRSIWIELGEAGVIWHDPVGSLHLAMHSDEWAVLQETADAYRDERSLQLLKPDQLQKLSPAFKSDHCFGGLFSPDEIIVNPQQAIRALPPFLREKYGIEFCWGKCVSDIQDLTVRDSEGKSNKADIVFICSGSDFETLYPEYLQRAALTKCKLQMMRTVPQRNAWRMGPPLCGGLSLIHYKSFSSASSIGGLRLRYEDTMSEYIKHGIHVMAAQNESGEITIGDSHEYGQTHEPFDSTSLNKLILDYLASFCHIPEMDIKETWNGIYAKATDGSTEIFTSPDPGVYILNALGGAGMTLSFGLAEETVTKLLG